MTKKQLPIHAPALPVAIPSESYIAANGPKCGHSACSQNYIDTGERDCIADDLTEEEQERAMAEGWLLAEGCEIQADDDSEAFRVGDASRDDLAIAHVRARAAEGSELHVLALRLHDADREEEEEYEILEENVSFRTYRIRAASVEDAIAIYEGGDVEQDYEQGDDESTGRIIVDGVTYERGANGWEIDEPATVKP